MKLTNLTKSVLAASALTVASFGANAGAIATSDLTISNLHFSFTGLAGAPTDSGTTFSGTEATATINGVGNNSTWAVGDSTDPDITPLYFTTSEGSGWITSDTGSAGLIDLTGSLTEGTSTGITNSSASAYGVNSSKGSASVQNSFTASFVTTGAAFLDIDFSWALSLYSEITDAFTGQTATSEYDFTITVESESHFYEVDLQDIIGGANKKTQKSFGSKSLVSESATTDGQFHFALAADEEYDVVLSQISTSNVVSVTEPTSVAILGLGLLGFAGAARRRKS